MIPLSKKDLVQSFRQSAAATASARSLESSTAKRIAIFAVHGISPIQRYAFQDQVALTLQSYLNACERAGDAVSWQSVVHWPDVVGSGPDTGVSVRPSSLRIYRSDDDPRNPAQRVYDVYEGYWSPLSKGKTNISSALRWLLNGTFLGTSSTANVPCSPGKLCFDLSYVLVLLSVVLLACGGAFACAYVAWDRLVASLPSDLNVHFMDLVQKPVQTIFKFPLLVYVQFLIDLLIGYVAAQIVTVFNAGRKRIARGSTLNDDADPNGNFVARTISARKFHIAMFGVLVIAFALLVWLAYVAAIHADLKAGPISIMVYIAAVAGFVAFLQAARSIGDFAVENVLGDIQVYTTHDCNSSFNAIRQEIIAAVALSLKGVLNAVVDEKDPSPQPYYDAVHIFGHSLGSTVAMDVLILLRQLIEEGTRADLQWKKIRSFTTFGTALEKTRFFFDVRQPSLNAAQDQWEGDVYGRFFTKDVHALAGELNDRGIYWSNHWYFRDIVSNAIVSYQSGADVGSFRWVKTSREICDNYQISHRRFPFAWVHSDYLGDSKFWATVGPIVTR